MLYRRVMLRLTFLLYETFYEFLSLMYPCRGLTLIKRSQEVVVSLTTIPERISKVHLCIETLLRQSIKPDRVILWLSETTDPARPRLTSDNIPLKLRRLQDRGLQIRWCADIRSYRKIIPVLRYFPKALVVTADDDVFYPRKWLEQLYFSYLKEPQFIHCHRAHLVKYDIMGQALPYAQWELTAPGVVGPSLDLFPTGVGGVLYAPHHLSPEVVNEKVFLEICPFADDVWLRAMSLLNCVECKKVKSKAIAYTEILFKNSYALSQNNVNLNGNDTQIWSVGSRYRVFGLESIIPNVQSS